MQDKFVPDICNTCRTHRCTQQVHVNVHPGPTRGEGFTAHVDYDINQYKGLAGVFVDIEGRRLCCVMEHDKRSQFNYLPDEVWSRVITLLHR